MKKVFLSALIVCSASMAMISCNNGDYDTNPNTNNSNVPNPFYNGGGGNGGGNGEFSLGNMSAKVNGTLISMPAYAVDTLGFFAMIGSKSAAPFNSFTIHFLDYQGKKVYEAGENTAGNLVLGYQTFEGTTMKLYQAATIVSKSHVKLEVTEDTDNKYKGTFEGVIYNYTSSGTVNINDSLIITEGKFYVSKK